MGRTCWQGSKAVQCLFQAIQLHLAHADQPLLPGCFILAAQKLHVLLQRVLLLQLGLLIAPPPGRISLQAKGGEAMPALLTEQQLHAWPACTAATLAGAASSCPALPQSSSDSPAVQPPCIHAQHLAAQHTLTEVLSSAGSVNTPCNSTVWRGPAAALIRQAQQCQRMQVAAARLALLASSSSSATRALVDMRARCTAPRSSSNVMPCALQCNVSGGEGCRACLLAANGFIGMLPHCNGRLSKQPNTPDGTAACSRRKPGRGAAPGALPLSGNPPLHQH